MKFLLNSTFIIDTQATRKTYRKGDTVISEGKIIDKFCYLESGELIVMNYTEEGKEFLQHKVSEHHFFGEPASLLGLPFPGNAVVNSTKAEVIFIEKSRFNDFCIKNPELLWDFTKSIAEKTIAKSVALKNLVFMCPEDRLKNMMLQYKREQGKEQETILIKLTRKELSHLTGLRIETVIRTIKKMEKEGKLQIKGGKIYF